MAFADRAKAGFVVFEPLRRTVAEVRSRRGKFSNRGSGVLLECRLLVDRAIHAVAVVADALAVKQGLASCGIPFMGVPVSAALASLPDVVESNRTISINP